MRFCFASLPNAGLANRLFPWARCKLFSIQNGVQMIAPQWSQFKVGPLLRGESDWRTYSGMFHATREELSGLRRGVVLATHPPARETADIHSLPARCVVRFEGMGEHFKTLNGHNGVLKRELEKAVLPRWLDLVSETPAPIGIHVRLGDFQPMQSEMDLITKGGVRTPMSWFIDTLRYVRQRLGDTVPAFVVSDGRRQELAELLAMPEVQWMQTGSAISDLLLLSRAKAIIATGGSSFSAWSSFLGEIPILAVPGQSPAWFHLHHAGGAYVGEFHVDRPPDQFERNLTELAASLRLAN